MSFASYGQGEKFHICCWSEDADDAAFWQAHTSVIDRLVAVGYRSRGPDR